MPLRDLAAEVLEVGGPEIYLSIDDFVHCLLASLFLMIQQSALILFL